MNLSQSQPQHLADMFKDSANVILAALVVMIIPLIAAVTVLFLSRR